MLVDTINLISDDLSLQNLNEIYPLLYRLLMDAQNSSNVYDLSSNDNNTSSSNNNNSGGEDDPNNSDSDSSERLTASLLKCIPRVNPQWRNPDRRVLERICRL